MTSGDSATGMNAAAKSVTRDDGLHHDGPEFWQQFTKEQRAALIKAALDPNGDPDSLLNAYLSQEAEKRSAISLKVKSLDDYLLEWSAFTPAQKNKAGARLFLLRKKVRALPPFENHVLELDRQDPEFLVRALCRHEADYKGLELPIEIYTLERLLSPEAQAWEQAAHYVNLALSDERLRRHPAVKEIFDKMAAAIDGHTFDDMATPQNVLRFLITPMAEKEAKTSSASHAARSKNAAPREWVKSIWLAWKGSDSEKAKIPKEISKELETCLAKQKRPEKGLSKEQFSECMSALLKKGFGDQIRPTEVRARQIYTGWLKGF